MHNRDGDRRVIEALEGHGSDLTKAAHTIHFLYFRKASAARAAAEELATEGYAPVRVGHAGPAWKRLFGLGSFHCIAENRATKTEEAVFATSDWMEALAVRHGGEYDGWEASVEPPDE